MQNIVILGRNQASLLNIIRQVGELGYKVTVIKTYSQEPPTGLAVSLSFELKSKYVKSFYFTKEPDDEALIVLLTNLFKDKKSVILIPTDDYVTSVIAKNRERLQDIFVYPNINNYNGSIIKAMDKNYQKELAVKNGISIIKGWVVDQIDNDYKIPKDLVFPIFAKPLISFYGKKRDMKICNNIHELEELLNEVKATKYCPYLLEQFINVEKEYVIIGFCDGKNILTPCLVEKKIIGTGKHLGVTMTGVVKDFKTTKPEVFEKIQNFLRDINFTGIIDIEIFENNGVIYFNELNLRPGAFSFAARCVGYNFTEFLLNSLNNKSNDYCYKSINKEVLCISEKVAYEDLVEGNSTDKTFIKRLKDADCYFIKSKSDPIPFFILMLKFRLRKIKKILK